jgi:hypothetical protein
MSSLIMMLHEQLLLLQLSAAGMKAGKVSGRCELAF